MSDIDRWITINGQHLPIMNGKSKNSVINRHIKNNSSIPKVAFKSSNKDEYVRDLEKQKRDLIRKIGNTTNEEKIHQLEEKINDINYDIKKISNGNDDFIPKKFTKSYNKTNNKSSKKSNTRKAKMGAKRNELKKMGLTNEEIERRLRAYGKQLNDEEGKK